MSTGTIPTPPPLPREEPVPPPLPESPEQRFIDEQLDRTRAQVKAVDMLFGALAATVGVLAILLSAAVVDHWIFGLGVAGRLAAFGLLVAWGGFCVWRWVVPSLMRRINPLYAAYAIERQEPSLKNSLINYLLIRSHPHETPVVRAALEHQAASDISAVPVEAAVDRTHVLRLGYALVAVVLALAVYKIASPKDPLQTVARVLAPLADISRPSRVTIREVAPGHAEVFHGRHATVSATVEGLRSGEEPTLLYSTADGQAVDVPVKLTADESGLRWQADLPPDSQGAQLDFRYRFSAGDAVTEEYRVRVSAAPSITVRSLHYDYPPYTRREPQTVTDHGDISALEGTRVTVRAEANLPIHSAWIEFDPPVGGGLLEEARPENAATLKRLNLKAEDRVAQGTFRLEWDAQAKAPRHRQYRVRFVTGDGQRNDRPVVHAIDVQRDLPPEVAILEPQQNRIEVPADGQREIVVRALDPDYGVSRIDLRAVAGGTDLLIPPLLNDPAGRTGQTLVKYNFAPRQHDLKAGDQVMYWARVEDNRTAPGQSAPEPNSARTANYHIVITPAAKSGGAGSSKSESENDPSAGEEKSDSGGGEKSEGDQGEEGSEGGSEGGSQGGEGGKEGDQEGGKQDGDQEGNQSGDKEGDQEGSEAGDKEGGEKSGQGESKAGQDGAGQSPDPQQGMSEGQAEEGDSGQPQAGGAKPNPGEAPSDSQAGDAPQDAGGQGSAPSEGNQPADSSDGSQNSGARGGQGGQAKSPPGGSPNQGQPADDGSQNQPLSSDGTQDREVFERLQDYLQQQQQKQGGQRGQNGSQNQPSGESPQEPAQGQPPAGEQSDGNAGSSKTPQPGEAPQNAGQRDQSDAAKTPDQKQGEAEGRNTGAGQGGDPQGPAETQKEQANPKRQPGETPPKPGQGDNGSSGAGVRPENPQGSPQSQEQNRDRQKNSEGGDQKQGDEGASSPSTSKRQSDSQGSQGGDQSGGGKQGGGQGAKQPGNDSAGSSSAADEGAGAANEPGAGETSDQPGSQQLADRPTGNPSQNTPGQGSGTQQNPAGQPTPSAEPSQPGSAPPKGQKTDSPPSPDAAQRGAQDGSGQHTFGSEPPQGSPPRPQDGSPPPAVPENAEVNLEYARKATDLALETLRDQKDQPDSELLKKLGWTPDDLQRFLSRWEALKKSAAQQGPAGEEARNLLDETLESLGLRPANSQVRRGATESDQQRGLRDAGHRTAPPAEYKKLFEAYLKGAGRTRGN